MFSKHIFKTDEQFTKFFSLCGFSSSIDFSNASLGCEEGWSTIGPEEGRSTISVSDWALDIEGPMGISMDWNWKPHFEGLDPLDNNQI